MSENNRKEEVSHEPREGTFQQENVTNIVSHFRINK